MVDPGIPHGVMAGIVTGSYIALGAIGLGLVYNISKVPNFAHGELLMLGAYLALIVNLPWTLPGIQHLASESDGATLALVLIVFLVTAGCALTILYLLGGWNTLRGSYWPVRVDGRLAVAVHILAASLLGLFVIHNMPGLFGGLILATVIMAAITPLLDRVVFEQFRVTGATLATLLIVTMGLSFILRFSAQSIFTESTQSYEYSGLINLFGTEINIRQFKELEFFVTDGGVIFNVVDTGLDPSDTIFLLEFTWITLGGVLLGTIVAGWGAYRLRGRGIDANEATQTIGPFIVGIVTGAIALIVLSLGLGSSGSVPSEYVTGTQIRTSYLRLGIVLFTIALMFALHVLLRETKLGKAMRASSDNLDLAEVTGIDTNRVMMSTWVIAGAFAAIAGVVNATIVHAIRPSMGFFLLLPMFAAVILGGLTSIYGAIVGSYIVGIAMEVGMVQLDISSVHRVSLAFAVLIIVLLVRPQGIVGGR